MREGREAVKMLAKETFACFYLFSLFGKRRERKGERGRERVWPAERQLVGGGWLRLRTSHCAFGVAITIAVAVVVARCPRLDCNCSCHSSIFVSLCSVRLKDCNIYLHLFSAAAFFWPLAARPTRAMGNSYSGFACIGMLCTRNQQQQQQQQQCFGAQRVLTSVFAAFYVIHGHSMGVPAACKKYASHFLQLLYSDLAKEPNRTRKSRNLCDFRAVAVE